MAEIQNPVHMAIFPSFTWSISHMNKEGKCPVLKELYSV